MIQTVKTSRFLAGAGGAAVLYLVVAKLRGWPPFTPEAKKYTITILISPIGCGTATATPSSSDAGVKITLAAFPASGYIFKKWTGDAVVADNADFNPKDFIMPGRNITVTANFEPGAPGTYTVTTGVLPLGAGTVTGGGTKNQGVTVTLTATPASARYTFSRWSGYWTGTVSPATFAMPAMNISVVANFTETLEDIEGVAARFTAYETHAGSKIDLARDAVYSYSDATRGITAAKLYAFKADGNPEAFLCIEQYSDHFGVELARMSGDEVIVTDSATGTTHNLSTASSGYWFDDLWYNTGTSLNYIASEHKGGKGGYGRMMSQRYLTSYSQPARGIIAAEVYLFTDGNNPEAILTVEQYGENNFAVEIVRLSGDDIRIDRTYMGSWQAPIHLWDHEPGYKAISLPRAATASAAVIPITIKR